MPHIADDSPVLDAPEPDPRDAEAPRLIVVPGRRPYPDVRLTEIRAELDADGFPEQPLKVRLGLQIFTRRRKMHLDWPGIAWVIEFMVPAHAVEFREALDGFVREYFRTHGGKA